MTRCAPALPWSQVCALILTVATATVVVSACQGSNSTGSTPGGSGKYVEDRTCKVGVANGALLAAGGGAFTNAGQTTSNGQTKACYFDVADASTNLTAYSTVIVPVNSVQGFVRLTARQPG